MTEPIDPDEYNAALDRFLDGLLDDPVTPADAQVRADTDAIAKALGLIGGALAAEGGGVTAAAGAVPPAAGGTVVAMSSWRSKLNPRVLAAAATLVVLVGVGIPVALSSSGGSSSNDTSALGSPDSATAESATTDTAAGTVAGAAPAAPQAAVPAPMAADTYTGAPGALANTGAGTAAGTGTATGADTGATAAGGSAMDSKSAKSAASEAAADAARQAATPEFEQAVACARAIVIGTVSGVQPDADGKHYNVTVLVEKWIAPNKTGPLSITYRVLGPTANSPGADESLYVGMRRLFVFGPSEDERAYSFQESDWPDTKKKIAAIREEHAGQGC